MVEEVFKQAKALKDSLKLKKVFLSNYLTLPQIVQLKKLIKTRNDENEMHLQVKTKANCRYGIRNDMVVKLYLI